MKSFVIFQQFIQQREVKVADTKSIFSLLRHIPKMFVFLQPLFRDLTDGTVGKFDVMLAALEGFADIVKCNLLIAKFDKGFEIEPVNARCDADAQCGSVAVDAAKFEIIFAVYFKARLRELRNGMQKKIEGVRGACNSSVPYGKSLPARLRRYIGSVSS